VSKSYHGAQVALVDASFEIHSGHLTIIIGPSGSGKTTTLQLINGLVKPTQGTVTVLGVNIEEELRTNQLRKLRSRIGFIFQDFGLTPRLSSLENALIGTLGQLRGPRFGAWSYPKQFRMNALKQLEKLDIAPLAHRRVDSLSGGQMQRVAIARALMQEPEILLADEPVASLDPSSSENILQILSKIAHEDNVAVVASLHQLELALKWADRLIGIKNGRILFDVIGERPTASQLELLYAK
jgi:phosphonate transport system ATP-binding protein